MKDANTKTKRIFLKCTSKFAFIKNYNSSISMPVGSGTEGEVSQFIYLDSFPFCLLSLISMQLKLQTLWKDIPEVLCTNI